jgi:hypothetical protein
LFLNYSGEIIQELQLKYDRATHYGTEQFVKSPSGKYLAVLEPEDITAYDGRSKKLKIFGKLDFSSILLFINSFY